MAHQFNCLPLVDRCVQLCLHYRNRLLPHFGDHADRSWLKLSQDELWLLATRLYMEISKEQEVAAARQPARGSPLTLSPSKVPAAIRTLEGPIGWSRASGGCEGDGQQIGTPGDVGFSTPGGGGQ